MATSFELIPGRIKTIIATLSNYHLNRCILAVTPDYRVSRDIASSLADLKFDAGSNCYVHKNFLLFPPAMCFLGQELGLSYTEGEGYRCSDANYAHAVAKSWNDSFEMFSKRIVDYCNANSLDTPATSAPEEENVSKCGSEAYEIFDDLWIP